MSGTSTDEDSPLILPPPNTSADHYTLTSSSDPDIEPGTHQTHEAVPMSKIPSSASATHIYAPLAKDAETASERQAAKKQKQIDEFEGWNDNDNWSDADSGEVDDDAEDDEDEVMKRRKERLGEEGRPDGSWGTWWDKDV